MAIAQPRLPLQNTAEWLESRHLAALSIVTALIALIALVDWKILGNVSIGLLYLFPILLAALLLSREEIFVLSIGCALLREMFSPFHWQPDYPIRISITFVTFCSFGMMISEFNRNRRLTAEHIRQQEKHLLFEREADNQLTTLVQTSPLSILITERDGKILLANDASKGFLGIGGESPAENVLTLLPAVAPLLPDISAGEIAKRLELESAGFKSSGEPFLAHVWLTVYRTRLQHLGAASTGERIAWVLWDESEDLRGRELAHSESLDATARVLMAAFSHEIKNLSAAAGVLAARISAHHQLGADEDIRALSRVIQHLADFATDGLHVGSLKPRAIVDLAATMDQVRVTIQPMIEQAGLRLSWNVQARLPVVHADQDSLVQVFLNLAANSAKAVGGKMAGEVRVDSTTDSNAVVIRFRDSGPGVIDAEHLFQPFRSATGGAGLGLYISRAMLRSFGGDLRYDAAADGACFVVRLLCSSGTHADSASSY